MFREGNGVKGGGLQKDLFRLLRENGPLSKKDVVALLPDDKPGTIDTTLHNLVRKGKFRLEGKLYSLIQTAPPLHNPAVLASMQAHTLALLLSGQYDGNA